MWLHYYVCPWSWNQTMKMKISFFFLLYFHKKIWSEEKCNIAFLNWHSGDDLYLIQYNFAFSIPGKCRVGWNRFYSILTPIPRGWHNLPSSWRNITSKSNLLSDPNKERVWGNNVTFLTLNINIVRLNFSQFLFLQQWKFTKTIWFLGTQKSDHAIPLPLN